jgi:hypothetical protein
MIQATFRWKYDSKERSINFAWTFEYELSRLTTETVLSCYIPGIIQQEQQKAVSVRTNQLIRPNLAAMYVTRKQDHINLRLVEDAVRLYEWRVTLKLIGATFSERRKPNVSSHIWRSPVRPSKFFKMRQWHNDQRVRLYDGMASAN